MHPRARSLLASLALLVTLAAGCTLGEEASVRLLNVSTGYGSLDLYAGDDRQLAAVAFDAISGYAEAGADVTEIAVTLNGITSALVSLDVDLAAGDHLTVVAYGTSGNAGLLAIDEDKGEADAGAGRLRVYNAAWSAGDLDVYVTAAGVDLDDVAPTYASVAPGAAGDDTPTVLDSGTYRLRVLAAGSKTDLRLDATALVLGSRDVINVVLGDTAGGVLVDAWRIPQQESATWLANPMARLRAVVGLGDGSGITVLAGDTTLVSGVPATSLSVYQLVAAGTVELAVSVDGTPAHSQSVTLEPGHDYSTLVHGASTEVRVALVEDDNTVPDDDEARVRLVNLMSALDGPIDLLVDYYPLVQGAALGTASSYAELTPGDGLRLDVVDSSTGAALHTMADVDIDAGAVHSVFMFGGPGDAAGLVREDR